MPEPIAMPVSPVDAEQEPTEPIVVVPDVEAEPTVAPVDTEDEDEAEPELTADQYRREAEKQRKRAISYHERLKAANEEIATLRAQINAEPDPTAAAAANAQAAQRRADLAEAIADSGIPFAVVKALRALDAATSPEAITSAIAALKPMLGTATRGAHSPPAEPTSAPTLDMQIADAMARGDVKASIRLKSEQARNRTASAPRS
jgi:multidrug efflux pump subunit AcrA (membrane-fusion protein)